MKCYLFPKGSKNYGAFFSGAPSMHFVYLSILGPKMATNYSGFPGPFDV
jgi:hypothetical protein